MKPWHLAASLSALLAVAAAVSSPPKPLLRDTLADEDLPAAFQAALELSPRTGEGIEPKNSMLAGNQQELLEKALQAAAYEMTDPATGEVRFEFKLMSETYYDTEIFRPNGKTLMLQKGVTASQAMDHVFSNPEKYGFECAYAIKLVQYRGIQKALGSRLFDDWYKDMQLGQLDMGDSKRLRSAKESAQDGLRIGDHAYFSNPCVSEEARAGGWNGENVIVLGEGTFFGHPFGITTEGEIVEHLNSVRKPGCTHPAFLQRGGQIRLNASKIFSGQ